MSLHVYPSTLALGFVALALCATIAAGQCPAGNAGPGCTRCPIGYWSAAGNTSCTACPPGFTSALGSVSLAACSVDTVYPGALALSATFAGPEPVAPGVYLSGGAAAVNFPVSLNCNNQPSSSFLFIIGGALSFPNSVSFVNGTCSVQWSVNGAASLAAYVTVVGNLNAVGAITLGAGAHLLGVATGVSVALGTGATTGMTACSAGSAGPPACALCPVATWSAAGALNCTACPPGLTSAIGSISSIACTAASNLGANVLSPTFAGPEPFIPGTYLTGGAATVGTPVLLNCNNSLTSNFLFVIGGALSFTNNVSFVNGICAVLWSVDGAVTLAAGVSVAGNIDAVGAISLGAGAHLNGIATGGSLVLGAGATTGAIATPVLGIQPLSAAFSGTFIPGIYSTGGAAAATLPVTLDCQGSSQSVFHFVTGGALSLTAPVLEINGPCQVTWTVTGAVSISGLIVHGDIKATGAISLAAGALLLGCPTAGGAVTLGIGATIICNGVITQGASS